MKHLGLILSAVALVVLFGGAFIANRSEDGAPLWLVACVVLALGGWLEWNALRDVQRGQSSLDAASFDRARSPGLFWLFVGSKVVFGVGLIAGALVFLLR